MNFFKKIKGGIYNGIGFMLIIGLSSVAYGAYVALTDVTAGSTLTANLFNQVLENQRTLKTTVDTVSTRVVPTGFVGAFNLSTCPTGRIPANGTNGTPDLRGEFIRGLDGGRGVDTGRGLATAQAATRVIINNSTNLGYGGGLFDRDHEISRDYDGSVESITGTIGYYASSAGSASSRAVNGVRVRPRNVALLYCVKQ